ncbi:AI-2E family transporter [Aurantimonas endophytica]|uniref:Putative PurR-regulated permease PerM n=1 Tax=Aurantimonas endophytica TaxID=1522175 RepID=A0A7W6MRG0_9HYPH|nr:AI-2E family transporter [Aurantimonas endophytica]MBB4005085.1 putative PurR-regulated permease PerM [Aurantimonas endophytica]MCO6406250.1 AI-2E family transporter [Aurantimonas endophytica]
MQVPQRDAEFARRILIAAGIIIALVAGVALLWVASDAVFLIFAGLLMAAVFAGLAGLLQRVGVPRLGALIAVFLLLIALIGGAFAWGGITLVQQFSELTDLVEEQLGRLPSLFQEIESVTGGEAEGQQDGEGVARLLPDPGSVLSSAVSLAGGLGNFFIALFIAIFVVSQPGIYRRGVVSLFPKPKRQRIDETLFKTAETLILWLAGQAISMATIFVVTLVALWIIGMPNAFLLALQAGLLAFIPTIGPFIGGAVIVLAGFADSTEMALYGLGAYVLIQAVESNITQPVAQRWTTALPPALTLGAQLVMGVLFGMAGLILAVPMVAVLKTLVDELYIKDTLGGPYKEDDEAMPTLTRTS